MAGGQFDANQFLGLIDVDRLAVNADTKHFTRAGVSPYLIAVMTAGQHGSIVAGGECGCSSGVPVRVVGPSSQE